MPFETPFGAAPQARPRPVAIRRFGGLELREGMACLDPCRSPDANNMVMGPHGLPQKRTGYRQIRDFADFGGIIHGLHGAAVAGEDTLLVHAGNRLYLNFADSARLLFTGLAAARSSAFAFGGHTYLLDGENLYRVEANGVQGALADPYVPTTRRLARPDGGGGSGEGANLLTPRRINSFVTDGEAAQFTLDARPAPGSVTATLPDGSIYTEGNRLSVNRQTATVLLAHPPPAGEAGLTVRFEAEDRPDAAHMAETIGRCHLSGSFGGAVYLSGNPDHPGREWGARSLFPPYFPEEFCGDVGDPRTAIAGYLRQQDGLVILKAPGADAGIYLRCEGMPPAQGGDGPPAIGGIANLSGLPLYLSREGIMRIAGTGRPSARESRPVSDGIGPLVRNLDPAHIGPAVVQGQRYLLPVGDALILGQPTGDSRSPVAWNRWQPFGADCLCALGDTLYFSRGSALYRFLDPGEPGCYLDDGAPIAAHWVSPTLPAGPGRSARPEALTLTLLATGRTEVAVDLLDGTGGGQRVGSAAVVPLDFGDIDFADFSFDGPTLPVARRFRLCCPAAPGVRLRLVCGGANRGMTLCALALETRPARALSPPAQEGGTPHAL